MHYMIENYFATKMYDELNNLETVINGNGIVERCDIEHLSGFLVYDEANEVVKIVDFDPTKFETWNGREVVIDEEKKKEFEGYEENRFENLIIPIAKNNLGDDFVNDNGLIWINGTLKKLLIYKGNLTESELNVENEKDIKLDHYTFQDNSIINKYGMKGFNKLMTYFPNLTAEEIAVEIGKKIRVDKLDFNPKSIKRYLSNLESFSGIKTYSQNLTEAEIVEEVSKDLVPLFRNTGAIPNSSGEVKEIEARVKVPAIGGAFDDDKKAGIYSSFWIDKNEKSNKIGTRIAWKK